MQLYHFVCEGLNQYFLFAIAYHIVLHSIL